MEGTGPIQDVSAYGVSKGLSEDWYSDTGSRKEFKKGDFWDVIDNPLYEAAAGALGYNWDEWVKESKGLVGTGPNDGTIRVRAVVKPGTSGVTRVTKKGGGFKYKNRVGTPAEYEWMTRDEADARGLSYQAAKTTRWRNKETGEVITGHPNAGKSERYRGRGNATLYGMALGDLVQGSGFESMFGSKKGKDWEDNWEELRDWGSHDAGINEDLDEISRWLHDIVSINDHIPKIIREGPQGKHYGIEGDIWEHYGLDKEPEPPKELDWDSYDKKMNLAKAVKSHVTYSTPEGITPVDLHSDN